MPLRLISYLAPSIPSELFALVASHIGRTCALETELAFETRISGPLAGDDEPFTDGRADIGFVCAPTYRWLREAKPNLVELLPLPVPLDARANGAPVYFADVVVRSRSPYRTFDDLRGATWAYNDPNSRSGWFSMLDRVGGDTSFFGGLLQSGSHLRSLDLVAGAVADAAAIDSNVIRARGVHGLRVLETWGPYAIQPVIIRTAIDAALRREIAEAMLSVPSAALRPYGFDHFAPAEDSMYR